MSAGTILIIEDNPLNLELATDLLESKGFAVSSAQTAEDGLQIAQETLPDLVLMDLRLPGMDGLCATRQIRTNPATRHLTVVGLTAHAMNGDDQIALQAGCDGYLTKPIDTRTFSKTIQGFISSASRPQIENLFNPDNNAKAAEAQRAEPLDSLTFLSLGLVLVVDDEEQNRTLLRDSLEARGYEVEEAANGMQALAKIADRAPDVILLDLMMPGMGGFEVCRELRKNLKTAHLPILMITAVSERGVRLMGIRAGANDFLTKPIDLQDVILRVANAVQAKHLHDQLQIEQEKSERLLLNILPAAIAERMKKGETNIVDIHAETTVLLANLVGFTSLSAHVDPALIVQLLNEVFSVFDVLVEKHGVEKIKSIGDTYMAAGGVSVPRADHAEAIAELAINLQREILRLNQQSGIAIRLRIGISTGPVIAGVIGRRKFAYDVWGETVNLAGRMESTAESGKIRVSESTYERLKDKYDLKKIPDSEIHWESDAPVYWLGDRLP